MTGAKTMFLISFGLWCPIIPTTQPYSSGVLGHFMTNRRKKS